MTADIILRFALAIGKPGGGALLINAKNESDGWASIEEAARSGRTFAVESLSRVLALDADSTESGALLEEEATKGMEAEGLFPVVVASGQIGHRHLFVRVRNPKQLRQWEEWARDQKIDVRREGSRIRPPLSPHRHGLPVRLIHPVHVFEALDRLSPGDQQDDGDRPRQLSPRTRQLLRNGDLENYYRSRSEMIHGIVLGAINSGFGLEYIAKALLDPQNAAGEKVQEIDRNQGRRSALKYVERSYQRALAKHREAFRDAEHVLDAIHAIRTQAIASGWRHRTGPTDRSVILAHLKIAERRKSLTYGASVREIAELAAVSSLGTVSRAHKRLKETGWLNLTVGRSRIEASTWTVKRARREENNLPHTPEGRSDCSPIFADQHADLWRRNGLGKRAFQIWTLLNGLTTRDLAKGLNLSRRIAQSNLQKLARSGLIQKDADGKWHRTNRDLDTVAKELGVLGEGERQRERHREEREAYRRFISPRRRLELAEPRTLDTNSKKSAVCGAAIDIGIAERCGASPQTNDRGFELGRE